MTSDEFASTRVRIGLVGGLAQALADLLVGDALLLGPVVDRQVEVEEARDVLLEAGDVPLLGDRRSPGCARATMSSTTPWRISSIVSRTLSWRHELLALLEHDLALVVHDVVVFEDVLADVEVARLDLRLRPLDRLVDPGMDDRLVLLEAELATACRPCARSRRCASGRPGATGRTSSGRDRPGGRSGRAAGCRCGGIRAARCRARRGRRPRAPAP